VVTFLNPPDEIIEDEPKDDAFIKQIAQAYTRVPDTDPDEYYGDPVRILPSHAM
jgi:hypothetical protein